MSDNEEGYMLAQSIFDIRNNHHAQFKEFAVLYRTNAQSRSLEEALRKKNIPTRYMEGFHFTSVKK